jgi:hypothetical protein
LTISGNEQASASLWLADISLAGGADEWDAE